MHTRMYIASKKRRTFWLLVISLALLLQSENVSAFSISPGIHRVDDVWTGATYTYDVLVGRNRSDVKEKLVVKSSGTAAEYVEHAPEYTFDEGVTNYLYPVTILPMGLKPDSEHRVDFHYTLVPLEGDTQRMIGNVSLALGLNGQLDFTVTDDVIEKTEVQDVNLFFDREAHRVWIEFNVSNKGNVVSKVNPEVVAKIYPIDKDTFREAHESTNDVFEILPDRFETSRFDFNKRLGNGRYRFEITITDNLNDSMRWEGERWITVGDGKKGGLLSQMISGKTGLLATLLLLSVLALLVTLRSIRRNTKRSSV